MYQKSHNQRYVTLEYRTKKGIAVIGNNSLRLNSKMVDEALLYYAKRVVLVHKCSLNSVCKLTIEPVLLSNTTRHRNGDITLNFTDNIEAENDEA